MDFADAMSICRAVNLRGNSNFTEFGKGFLNHSLYPLHAGSGNQDVTRQFQPQQSETQAASRNPRAAGLAGADPGGALDAGTRPFARGRAGQADRARLRRIRKSRAAQRRCPARSHLVGRDGIEIGGLYPRLGRRHRPQLRHPARQPAGQSAVDTHPADCRQGRTRAMLDQQHLCRSRSQRPDLSQEGAREPRLCLQRLLVRQGHQQAGGDGGLSGIGHQ